MRFTNTRKVRIEWGDCDPAGIIFYPRYFDIFDASTALIFERALGMTKFQMFKTFEFAGFPLVRTRARFLKPTRFGDDVTVESKISFGRSSFDVEHRLSLNGEIVRRVLGKAGLGGARCRRPAQVPSGAGCGAREIWQLDHYSISAAIFFKIWMNRLRSRAPMTWSRLRSCRRAQRVIVVRTFFPAGVTFKR